MQITRNDNELVIAQSCALIYESQILLRYKFNPTTYVNTEGNSITDLSVVVKDTDGNVLRSFSSDEFETFSTTVMYVDFDGLAANEMRKPIVFEVYANGELASMQVQYSIQTYAYNNQDKASIGDLVKAMIRFGDSAAIFLV